VRGQALVQVQPDDQSSAVVVIGGILEDLKVRDGQAVREGDVLAVFRSQEEETRLEDTRIERTRSYNEYRDLSRLLGSQADALEETKAKLEQQMTEARGKYVSALNYERTLETQRTRMELKAARAGIVMNPPRIDEAGKYFEKGAPFCTIGNPRQLRVLMPVDPVDYRLLEADKQKSDIGLPVTIRVQGRANHTWHGRISHLPESEAKRIPPALTTKGGGDIAVKPATKADPDGLVPQKQQYLIGIDILDSDNRICPGTMAQVKVHCRWRTCAWWAWRTFASAFSIGNVGDYVGMGN